MYQTEPLELKALMESDQLHAVVDVRERGEYAKGQIFRTTNVPRGDLELRIDRLVPWKEVKIVTVCNDGRRSDLAAQTLGALGFKDVAVLRGGLRNWQAEGLPIIEGSNVPGKEYGERVLVQRKVPEITVEELYSRLQAGQQFVIIDPRTEEEYVRGHLPGAYSIPGGQLSVEIANLASDTNMPIVVHCAGRTRSIVGADILCRMGYRSVFALKGGTAAWQLANHELEKGAGRRGPGMTEASIERGKEFARRVIADYRVPTMLPEELKARLDRDEPLYLLDVRLAKEYQDGHIPKAISLPGGQLVLGADDIIAVWRAPIVLYGDNDARSAVGAGIYKEMGLNVFLLEGGVNAWVAKGFSTESVRRREPVLGLEEAKKQTKMISPADLRARLEHPAGILVLDVRGSGDFAAGHIAGARWVSRGSLELQTDRVASDKKQPLVTYCSNGIRSTLAAATLRSLGYEDVSTLDGGLDAWNKTGFPLQKGLEGADVDLSQVLEDLSPLRYGDALGFSRERAERYLKWEEGLGEKFKEQPQEKDNR